MESIRIGGIEKWNRSESVGSKKESNSNRNFGEPESKKLEPNLSSILTFVSFYELIETYEEKESKTHSILSIRFLRFRVPEVSIPVRFFFDPTDSSSILFSIPPIPVRFFFRSHRFRSIPYSIQRFQSIPTQEPRFDSIRIGTGAPLMGERTISRNLTGLGNRRAVGSDAQDGLGPTLLENRINKEAGACALNDNYHIIRATGKVKN